MLLVSSTQDASTPLASTTTFAQQDSAESKRPHDPRHNCIFHLTDSNRLDCALLDSIKARSYPDHLDHSAQDSIAPILITTTGPLSTRLTCVNHVPSPLHPTLQVYLAPRKPSLFDRAPQA